MSEFSVLHLLAPFAQSPFLLSSTGSLCFLPILLDSSDWFLDFLQLKTPGIPDFKARNLPIVASLTLKIDSILLLS